MTPPESPGAGTPGRPARHIPPGTVSIRCRLDGPLVVELAPDLAAQGVLVRLTDHEGVEIPPPPTTKASLALCRCGQSRRRPFCDGSHVAAGFRSAGDGERSDPGGEAG